jgi:hypothetical protein
MIRLGIKLCLLVSICLMCWVIYSSGFFDPFSDVLLFMFIFSVIGSNIVIISRYIDARKIFDIPFKELNRIQNNICVYASFPLLLNYVLVSVLSIGIDGLLNKPWVDILLALLSMCFLGGSVIVYRVGTRLVAKIKFFYSNQKSE